MITIKFFANLRDLAGTDEIVLDQHPSTITDLLPLLAGRYPGLAPVLGEQKRILVAVNQEFADEAAELRNGDEIALLPPFSGGDEHRGVVRIQEPPFSVEDEINRIKATSLSIGGIVTFLGTTRDISRGTAVSKLEFEHYPGMAERKLNEIRERAFADFDLIDLSIIHRIGAIPAGENIVLIVVAAGHRDTAFKACRFCIDELKRITPIWKKETSSEGVVWVDEHP